MTNIGNMYGPDFTFLGIPRCDLDKPESYNGADVLIITVSLLVRSANSSECN